MNKNSDKGLETLQVWQRAMAFSTDVCNRILPMLPAEEKWCLQIQLRRSVQSIAANIAEGYGRYYFQEGVHFSYIARGSLEETFSHLTQAFKLNYISAEIYNGCSIEIVDLRRMLNGYIGFLKHSKRGYSEPGADPVIHEDLVPYLTVSEDTTPDP